MQKQIFGFADLKGFKLIMQQFFWSTCILEQKVHICE